MLGRWPILFVMAVGFVLVLFRSGNGAAPKSQPESARLFGEIATVLQSPRCLNCHTDAAHPFPRQGDDGHRHMFNVERGPTGHGAAGLHCATSHQSANNQVSGVPGAPGWHLAPLSMAWEQLSAKEICRKLIDPRRNGGRSLARLADHFARERLVLWSWSPGVNRAGVPRSTPPLSHDEFMRVVSRWIATGAACPEQ
ncbi:MAG TPA: hypothetical protein VKS24_01720 [Bradyrhizobium sp.]|nr:hypothetical protein [Bradyrhizobium sp.]